MRDFELEPGKYYSYIITWAQVYFKIVSMTECLITFYCKRPYWNEVPDEHGGIHLENKLTKETRDKDYFNLWIIPCSDEEGFRKLGI